MKQSTDSSSAARGDNPINSWTDQQVAEAARNTLKTLGQLALELRKRGYWVSVDSHVPNYIPQRFNATKQVKL